MVVLVGGRRGLEVFGRKFLGIMLVEKEVGWIFIYIVRVVMEFFIVE